MLGSMYVGSLISIASRLINQINMANLTKNEIGYGHLDGPF